MAMATHAARAALLACLVVPPAACAPTGPYNGHPNPAALERQIMERAMAGVRERHALKQDRERRFELERAAHRDDIAARVHGPLRTWLAEPAGSCGSPNLGDAVASARGTSSGIVGASLELNQLSAELMLDVADAAAERGCPDVARGLYRDVVASYVGLGYAGHRERAAVGLAEIREEVR